MKSSVLAWFLVAAALGHSAEGVSTPASEAKRQVTPETAARISAATQRLAVPPAELKAPTATAESPIAREPAKPRNQIIRLPDYVVQEPKLHGPTKELQVLTPKGRVALALERRPGLRIGGPLAWLNQPIAIAMLEDDLRAERRREEAELWSLYRIQAAAPTVVSSP
ncbi:hypothetical protein [Horticoccus sp. 23ND18S-11]|uniref:hypothetical protein n=1 Tax=Horticoccus sp. 23ND18S-11 TaxID=3391832 RepID=UPI0039C95CF8